MDTSLRALQEAVAIRRQIDSLEKRLASLLSGGAPSTALGVRRRKVSTAARSKLAAAARARRARAKLHKGAPRFAKKKAALTAAGRRKLSQLMKARWAARRSGYPVSDTRPPPRQ